MWGVSHFLVGVSSLHTRIPIVASVCGNPKWMIGPDGQVMGSSRNGGKGAGRSQGGRASGTARGGGGGIGDLLNRRRGFGLQVRVLISLLFSGIFYFLEPAIVEPTPPYKNRVPLKKLIWITFTNNFSFGGRQKKISAGIALFHLPVWTFGALWSVQNV